MEQPVNSNDSRTDAELHGEPYPRDAAEAATKPPRELVDRETGP